MRSSRPHAGARGPRTSTEVWLARGFISTLVLLALLGLSGLLEVTRISILPCPIRTVTGIVCPGCGMTRACLAVTAGDLDMAMRQHPFAPLLILWAGAAAVFPGGVRRLTISVPPALRTALAVAVIAGLVGRWFLILLGIAPGV